MREYILRYSALQKREIRHCRRMKKSDSDVGSGTSIFRQFRENNGRKVRKWELAEFT